MRVIRSSVRPNDFENSESINVGSIMGDFGFLIAAIMSVYAMAHTVLFIDTRFGNLEVPNGYKAIRIESRYEVINEDQIVVNKRYIKGIKEAADIERQRRKDAEDHAEAMGVPSFAGGRSGVILLVDITMSKRKRPAIAKMLEKTVADKILVIGFGDTVETGSRDLQTADDEQRGVFLEQLKHWQEAKHRRLLDALEAALSVQGCTRIDLCLADLPSGGQVEVLEFLKRRNKDLVPLNGIDFSSGNSKVEMFLRLLAKTTQGTYSRGR